MLSVPKERSTSSAKELLLLLAGTIRRPCKLSVTAIVHRWVQPVTQRLVRAVSRSPDEVLKARPARGPSYTKVSGLLRCSHHPP